jgi:hypothetical protein
MIYFILGFHHLDRMAFVSDRGSLRVVLTPLTKGTSMVTCLWPLVVQKYVIYMVEFRNRQLELLLKRRL